MTASASAADAAVKVNAQFQLRKTALFMLSVGPERTRSFHSIGRSPNFNAISVEVRNHPSSREHPEKGAQTR